MKVTTVVNETGPRGKKRAVLIVLEREQDYIRTLVGDDIEHPLYPLLCSIDSNRPVPGNVISALCDYYPEIAVAEFLMRAGKGIELNAHRAAQGLPAVAKF